MTEAAARAAGLTIRVVAPFGRDADSLARLLERDGWICAIHASMADMAASMGDDTGAVLMTEEALTGSRDVLTTALAVQPDWSDVPFVLLASRRGGAVPVTEAVRRALPETATNVIVLERPIGSVSLLSSILWALRARTRQFETRDRIAALAQREAELRESRRALQASDRELRLVADSLPVLIGFVDRDEIYRFANRAYEDWVYRSPAEVVGRSLRDVLGEQKYAVRLQRIAAAMAGEMQSFELDWPHRDGQRRVADIRYLPRFGDDGAVDGFHIFVQDVTDRRDAEEVLRTAAETLERRVAARTAELATQLAERERIEAALRQAQKMEAVGQLTGGIAHDFNNMLTGIMGAIDIMKRRIASGRTDDLDRFMEAASTSARRAAGLTHRLLAFSRRQSLDSKPIDVNALVTSLHDLLARTLSERVALTVVPGRDVPFAVADANQLESAILNLAINARDAMPAGGRLTVTTSAVTLGPEDVATRPGVTTGDYVRIAVSDTGTGMTPEVLEKIFEPFFTTKPIGQGTGLGLSMVYGFARQSGGHVRVDSVPGEGTTVILCLPATPQDAEALPAGDAVVPQGDGQTVLVVEDDESVRLLILDVLGELGYAAIEAGAADAAIPILASEARIDLLVSDVGLPGMNGRALAEVARAHRPELPILFVTGYAEQASDRSGFLGHGMALMTKPFALDALAGKIRDMLAG